MYKQSSRFAMKSERQRLTLPSKTKRSTGDGSRTQATEVKTVADEQLARLMTLSKQQTN
ncbi:hypothetical protein UFOVP606_25 [uncultured Caudovirales phage]|uniref:Uncharacterized protein n=1 Tax=uncultured Caudovirales phage TaxID=2100421 RepID=A0A6J5N6C2_9CAUD|nr:hypothetical protein UFOVP606_25 [uncultured Caudovirales phage]